MGKKILAIDPGPVESAYAILDENLKPIEFGKIENDDMLDVVNTIDVDNQLYNINGFVMAIEMIASYGMAVGKDVFETVFWIGRYWEAARTLDKTKVYRKDVKMNLCHSMKAKDSNIRQALIDRFGEVGTKKKPGWFYGVKKDIWSAVAVGVTYADKLAK